MKKLNLDWSVVDCKDTGERFQTEEDIRKVRQNLEQATEELFDKHEQNQRKAWENASNLFLD